MKIAPLRSMSGPGTVPDPGRSEALVAIQVALDAAIRGLDARDRLRLRLCYGEDLTLAQIGRVTGEHEATVSRKLERARRLSHPRGGAPAAGARVGDQAIAECFAQAADAPELHLTRLLSRAEDG